MLMIFCHSLLSHLTKIRYLENRVVTRSGEKTIAVHNPADDYDGGSRGKIKTKGKRGPGFVMG